MLTKELDAYYHVYIHRFQKLETELQSHMLSSEEVIDFLKSERPERLGDSKSSLNQLSS